MSDEVRLVRTETALATARLEPAYRRGAAPSAQGGERSISRSGEHGTAGASRIDDVSISRVFERALTNSILDGADTAMVFHDLTALEHRVRDLAARFPTSTLHAAAIKANPLIRILNELVTFGAGLEAASVPEVRMALHAGAPPSRIVFDSPAKTVTDLSYALALGCHINADSIDELDRIAKLKTTHAATAAKIGIRINPQVGVGRIAITSVAGHYSKFGVPLDDQRRELLDRFLKYDWLTGVHLHIGSQGCPPELLFDGIDRVLEFVDEANTTLHRAGVDRRISVFDLGGGLPVSYHRNIPPYSMEQYASELRRRFPQLFDDSMQLITEFGRYLHANSGWIASRVEYVKVGPHVKTAMIHVGADLLLRECYAPADWHHDLLVLDASGRIKQGIDSYPYVIAGPLCFSGDILAREVSLPPINEGDYIIFCDAGAYTLSMWSRYNSRQIPKVIGYRRDGAEMLVVKQRETIEDIIGFWS